MKINEEYKVDLSDELEEITKRVSSTLAKFEHELYREQLVKLGWTTPEQKKEMIDALIDSINLLERLQEVVGSKAYLEIKKQADQNQIALKKAGCIDDSRKI